MKPGCVLTTCVFFASQLAFASCPGPVGRSQAQIFMPTVHITECRPSYRTVIEAASLDVYSSEQEAQLMQSAQEYSVVTASILSRGLLPKKYGESELQFLWQGGFDQCQSKMLHSTKMLPLHYYSCCLGASSWIIFGDNSYTNVRCVVDGLYVMPGTSSYNLNLIEESILQPSTPEGYEDHPDKSVLVQFTVLSNGRTTEVSVSNKTMPDDYYQPAINAAYQLRFQMPENTFDVAPVSVLRSNHRFVYSD